MKQKPKKRKTSDSRDYRKNVTISQMIEAHSENHTKNTRDVAHALLVNLQRFKPRDVPVRSIDEHFCYRFADYLLERLQPNSVQTYLQKLHSILQEAEYKGIIRANPMPPLHRLVPRFTAPQRSFLTAAEVCILERTPCPHESTKQAFLFACNTGLRISDIETLQWRHIQKINGTLMIVKIQVKTKREIRIPIGNNIREMLAGIPMGAPKDHVFKLMSRTIIASDLRVWAAAAGIDKHVSFHVSRHTFATLSLSADIDLHIVSKLCGHTNVKTTEIYAHIVDFHLLEGINKLDLLLANEKKNLFHGD